jgi:hypothetical protein
MLLATWNITKMLEVFKVVVKKTIRGLHPPEWLLVDRPHRTRERWWWWGREHCGDKECHVLYPQCNASLDLNTSSMAAALWSSITTKTSTVSLSLVRNSTWSSFVRVALVQALKHYWHSCMASLQWREDEEYAIDYDILIPNIFTFMFHYLIMVFLYG